jgi:hypothetical protein
MNKVKSVHIQGEVAWAWCKDCWERTEQVWDGKGWVCLGCHPELRPQRAGNDATTAD